MTEQNNSKRVSASIHTDLIALVRALERRVDDAKTAEEVATIADQICAVNKRVTKVGALVIEQDTKSMKEAAALIRDALPQVVKAIEDAEALASAARHVTSALALVDSALGTLRLAA